MSKDEKPIPKGIRFVLGGMSGCGATCIIQPLDLVKTRMQVALPGTYTGGVHAFTSILKEGGPLQLYNGLSAALLRQIMYSSTRLGLFTNLMEYQKKKNPNIQPSVWHKLGFGLSAGGIASIVGNPSEVCLVRMTADGRLPKEQQRGYKNVGNALYRIVSEEGVLTLWKGCTPTIVRAMVLNAAQLGSYTQIKEMLLNTPYFEENFKCHLAAASSAGVISSFASLPVDNIKTRVQNMLPNPDGSMPYKGPGDCVAKIVRSEGVFALWTGIGPYVVRISPHAIFTLMFLEQLTKLYRQMSN